MKHTAYTRSYFYLTLTVTLIAVSACDFSTPSSSEKLDADAGPDQIVPLDESFNLLATASGGLSPYRFRWSLEDQPDESTFELTDANTNALLEVDPLPVNGSYLFRVLATDRSGQSNASFAKVLVGGDLDITATAADTLRLVGESTQLSSVLDADTTGISELTYAWSVVDGEAEFDDASISHPLVTILSAETVRMRVSVTGQENGIERFGLQDVFVVGIEDATPQVIIDNTGSVKGRMVLELLTEAAPNTCANFLRYVDSGYYDGIIWHRIVQDFVVQTGNFERFNGEVREKPGKRAEVQSEANNGFSNLRSAIAMALRGTEADSGSNQFFINLGDNSSLDDGNPPFTVFARVIEGMDVADEIVALPTGDPGTMTDQPNEDVVMSSVTRAESKIPTSPPDDIRVVDTNGMEDANSNGVDDASTNGMDDADTNGMDDPGILPATVTTSVPIQILGESVDLSASIENEPEGSTYSWTTSNGMAAITDASAKVTTATIDSNDSIVFKVEVRGPDGEVIATGEQVVVGIPSALPRVTIENGGNVVGDITLELLTEDAPGTCANFLRYVDAGFYDGIIWHRVVEDFVIQMGGFRRDPDAETLVRTEGIRDAIMSEAHNGNSNVRGSVAFALVGQDADSATSQIFINLVDNPNLDDGPPPFTVFARVITGLDVVDRIGVVKTETQGPNDDVPSEDIVINQVRRASR
jgi:cyclophilin family peptidyl-prolyl cis-trans isomerase